MNLPPLSEFAMPTSRVERIMLLHGWSLVRESEYDICKATMEFTPEYSRTTYSPFYVVDKLKSDIPGIKAEVYSDKWPTAVINVDYANVAVTLPSLEAYWPSPPVVKTNVLQQSRECTRTRIEESWSRRFSNLDMN